MFPVAEVRRRGRRLVRHTCEDEGHAVAWPFLLTDAGSVARLHGARAASARNVTHSPAGNYFPFYGVEPLPVGRTSTFRCYAFPEESSSASCPCPWIYNHPRNCLYERRWPCRRCGCAATDGCLGNYPYEETDRTDVRLYRDDQIITFIDCSTRGRRRGDADLREIR